MCSLVKDLKNVGILREFKSYTFTLRVLGFKESSGKESPTA